MSRNNSERIMSAEFGGFVNGLAVLVTVTLIGVGYFSWPSVPSQGSGIMVRIVHECGGGRR